MSHSADCSRSSPVIRRRIILNSEKKHDRLLQFAHDNTSQNGEDGILRHIFEVLLPRPPYHRMSDNNNDDDLVYRYCVDVGAWDGRHLSNTYSLLVPSSEDSTTKPSLHTQSPQNTVSSSSSSWWKGVLIEADHEKFQELESLHKPLGNICIHSRVSSDPSSEESLSFILQRPNVQMMLPDDIDFLCIDVDGLDYWLLHDVLRNTKYRPKVICIEFNPTMPNDLIYIPPCNDNIRQGASLSALVELANEYDYLLVETTLYNAFFVPKLLYQQYFQHLVPDTSIEALHEPTMGTSLYQLYDGNMKLWGCKKLLWHRVPIDEERIQMLPLSQRQFPFAPNFTSVSPTISDPVIDISAYCQRACPALDKDENLEQLDKKNACSLELLRQLKSDGFALVRGTGIPAQLCQDALRVAHSFLHVVDESVRRSCLSTRDRARRGYSPINTENFASLMGEQGPNDLVRKFRIGPESSSASSSLLQPNIWPTSSEQWGEKTNHEFRLTLEAYYNSVCVAANAIVQCICDAVLLEDEGLEQSLDILSSSPEHSLSLPSIDNHQSTGLAHKSSILTLLGYQTGSRHKRKHHKKERVVHPLVASHTDVGVITVLLYDGGDCAVLQRRISKPGTSSKEQFQDILLPHSVPNDPIFVVNIGDCLSELTRKTLPSTIHRVVPREGSTPRNCLALFVGLDPEQELKLSEGIVVSYETWRKNRIAESQKVLRRK
jgi:isopenicillin N synthase-like dioxygenase